MSTRPSRMQSQWGRFAVGVARRAAYCFFPIVAMTGLAGEAVPKFSEKKDAHISTLTLDLTAPKGVIHYTLDGSEPTTTSAVWTQTLVLTNTTCVRARAFSGSTPQGPTQSRIFTLVSGGLAGFNSNVPLLALNTFGRAMTNTTKIPAHAIAFAVTNGRSEIDPVF